MDRVRIPNDATYSPIGLLDLAVAAPLASRLLLGATLPGRLLQTAVMGAYLASALQDWVRRMGIRKIDFLAEFGADVDHLPDLPESLRQEEIRTLTARLNDGWTPRRLPRDELAVEVDRHLTDYIAGITGQRVETSTAVRSHSVAQLVFPFALGACDFLSGDIAIFRDTGIFEPHVVAHEFTHRKGYWKELEAQALAYLALASSGDPVLVQSALAERLHRNLRVLAGEEPGRFRALVEGSGLRAEIKVDFLRLHPHIAEGRSPGYVEEWMRRLYDQRMRMTGQNGISDYDLGFTNFLYGFETSPTARRTPPGAGAVHTPPRAA